jgi:hypothetical protein
VGSKIHLKKLPSGLFMVNEMERQAYSTTKIDKPIWEQEESLASAAGANVEIPEDLVSQRRKNPVL